MQPSAKQAVKNTKTQYQEIARKKKKKSKQLLLYAYHKIRFVAVTVDEVDFFFLKRRNQQDKAAATYLNDLVHNIYNPQLLHSTLSGQNTSHLSETCHHKAKFFQHKQCGWGALTDHTFHNGG